MSFNQGYDPQQGGYDQNGGNMQGGPPQGMPPQQQQQQPQGMQGAPGQDGGSPTAFAGQGGPEGSGSVSGDSKTTLW